MADGYWDHPARREIKRLIDLGDANAILDDLQNRETEWDDARAALDHLVRGAATARAEVKRLRAALGTEVRRNSAGRTVPSGAPDSMVRAWAREHGIPTNPKGRVAPDVRSAYEAAWRAEQDGGDPC